MKTGIGKISLAAHHIARSATVEGFDIVNKLVGQALDCFFAGPSHMRRQNEIRQVQQLHQRSEEHTSELQSLMRISYAVFCLKKKKKKTKKKNTKKKNKAKKKTKNIARRRNR